MSIRRHGVETNNRSPYVRHSRSRDRQRSLSRISNSERKVKTISQSPYAGPSRTRKRSTSWGESSDEELNGEWKMSSDRKVRLKSVSRSPDERQTLSRKRSFSRRVRLRQSRSPSNSPLAARGRKRSRSTIFSSNRRVRLISLSSDVSLSDENNSPLRSSSIKQKNVPDIPETAELANSSQVVSYFRGSERARRPKMDAIFRNQHDEVTKPKIVQRYD